MKKIFTLIAAAMMAVGVNAQDVIVFENGVKPVDDQTFTQGDLTLQLGKDIKKAKGWDNKASSVGKGENMIPFIQKLMVKNEDSGEMEEKERVVVVNGGNNPKDDEENKGSGYKPASMNLPQSGTYYKVTATKNGTIVVGIVLNADKGFYICKAADGSNIPSTDYIMKNGADGTDVTVTDDMIAEKITGTVEFKVVANETYYVFCTGSKLGCFGVQFTASSDESGISNITATENVNAPAYNLAGQRVNANAKGLVIKNGKKFMNK